VVFGIFNAVPFCIQPNAVPFCIERNAANTQSAPINPTKTLTPPLEV
jgi:hypothetical protein